MFMYCCILQQYNIIYNICNCFDVYNKYLVYKYLPVYNFQTGSILRVLEVLMGTGVDDRVYQSALTQISVMTEDPQLHSVFLDHHGLPVLLKILTSSLVCKLFIYYIIQTFVSFITDMLYQIEYWLK